MRLLIFRVDRDHLLVHGRVQHHRQQRDDAGDRGRGVADGQVGGPLPDRHPPDAIKAYLTEDRRDVLIEVMVVLGAGAGAAFLLGYLSGVVCTPPSASR
nr:hypothetical protein [Acrocarpospora macrocephala]